MKKYIAAALLSLAAVSSASAFSYSWSGEWYVEHEGWQVNIKHNNRSVVSNAYSEVTFNFVGDATEYTYNTTSFESFAGVDYSIDSPADDVALNDALGASIMFHIKWFIGASKESPDAILHQTFRLFDDGRDYVLSQVELEGVGRDVESRKMIAFASWNDNTPVQARDNRAIYVPFYNDGYASYASNTFFTRTLINTKGTSTTESHEVSAYYNSSSRAGFVLGSIDHDKWKSSVTFTGYTPRSGGNTVLSKIQCLSGYTNYDTTGDTLPHGKVKGNRIGSARFMDGDFDDWRTGLETFGEVCNTVAPGPVWTGGNPMGYSTWGAMKEYVSYDGVKAAIDFIDSELRPNGFGDLTNSASISLDAFAEDNISRNKISYLGNYYLANSNYNHGNTTQSGKNMTLGAYCGPLVGWSWAFDSNFDGSSHTVREALLKVNGSEYKVPKHPDGGHAIDPTHPGVREHIENFMRKYAMLGVKYVKADFLDGGIVEGDSWYDPEVTTGVMAYNYGMKILREQAEKYGMYVVESIAPVFPANYAHGRRVCCDVWNSVSDSQYAMNAMSYGWWTDRIYTVNDPDHLVMIPDSDTNGSTAEGISRMRATSGVCTGAFIFGDNLSENVKNNNNNTIGNPSKSKERLRTYMGNKDVNDYVRNNLGSFRPVDGGSPVSGTHGAAETQFYRIAGNYCYVAVFNYGTGTFSGSSSGTISFDRLGVDSSSVGEIKELWTGNSVSPSGNGLPYDVPKSDARIYRITLN